MHLENRWIPISCQLEAVILEGIHSSWWFQALHSHPGTYGDFP